MPYITQDRRTVIDYNIDALIVTLKSLPKGPAAGDLNYTISRLLLEVFDIIEQPKYQKFNDIVGLLDNVKHEIQRRWQDPYEQEKAHENGDIV
jgi:hypothetical protein